VFSSRTIDMPAVAFWMKPVVVAPACAKHMLTVVLRRRGMTDADFETATHGDVAGVLAEWCTALPSSLPYLEDVYAFEGSRHAYESFDDIFARGSGDCEDFSRGMCALFEAARGASSWRDASLRRLHAMAQRYVPVAVLSTVASMAYDPLAAATDDGHERAHMYTRFVPRASFHRMVRRGANDAAAAALFPTASTFAPWEHDLPTFVGEGTARVGVDFRARSAHEPADQRKCASLPSGFTRYQDLSFDDGPSGFYRRDVHLLTGHFAALGQSGQGCPAFFSLTNAEGAYGVDFGSWDNGPGLKPATGIEASELATIRSLMALEQPSPVLLAPRCRTTAGLAEQWATNTGWLSAGRGATGSPTRRGIDFFCTTPDQMSSQVFSHVIRELYNSRGSPIVTTESFATNFPPQLRIRLFVDD
jgi:hypothetical protein